ncbi:MAG TPA: NapC/NirT family cytochrome c [Candidatus Acidoferrales bacterium]|nr:NapC/NirT family cytochrome c [Candidatus Acidoferrales bacterium]
MNFSQLIRMWLRPIYYFSQNPVSLAGVVLTTSSAITLLAFWFYFIVLPGPAHPYLGILVFLILPGLFVLGLLLIPIGIVARRRALKARGELLRDYPQVDFALPGVRRSMSLVGALTFANFFLIGTASYQGVSYMDSTQFCGLTCHTVMAPEYTAYQNSPHSRVECVACHIGPGASWFVRSKLSGLRQVYAVIFHTYSRPIPSPVKYLRPARETCEQCHWPQRFTGDKFLVKVKYQDDEKNTKVTTVLLMKVGGVTWQGREGIHGKHLETASRIHYISIDPERMVIPVVNYVTDSGKTISFVSTDIKTTPEQLAKGEHREMDCVDCHNRPTHAFELPESGVDKQMASGRISPELPFIKKKAVELLKANYADRDTARQQIIQGIDDFYRTSYPQVYATRRALVQQSAEEVANLYLRNVFPAMRVTWGSHPNNIGHMDSPGCFRCHDGSHTSADGQTIPNDCGTCHTLLAMEEPNPKILEELGMQGNH